RRTIGAVFWRPMIFRLRVPDDASPPVDVLAAQAMQRHPRGPDQHRPDCGDDRSCRPSSKEIHDAPLLNLTHVRKGRLWAARCHDTDRYEADVPRYSRSLSNAHVGTADRPEQPNGGWGNSVASLWDG